MKLRYRLLFLSVLPFLSPLPGAAQKILSTGLSRDSILIGDQVEWSSIMQVPDGLSVRIDPMEGYVVPGVELIDGLHIDTLSLGKDFADIEARATITSFDSGSYVLPPLMVYFYRGETLEDTARMGSVSLYVNTIPVDTASYQMYDIRPQFKYPLTFKEVAPWVGLSLGVAALIVAIVLAVERASRRKSPGSAAMEKEPPHIVALRELEKIRQQKLWQEGKQKQYYTLITDTLRTYIENRFEVKTFERTSNEILHDMKSRDISPEVFDGLKDLLNLADLVKFAKYTADAQENENAVPSAVKFVNATFMAKMEEEKKNG